MAEVVANNLKQDPDKSRLEPRNAGGKFHVLKFQAEIDVSRARTDGVKPSVSREGRRCTPPGCERLAFGALCADGTVMRVIAGWMLGGDRLFSGAGALGPGLAVWVDPADHSNCALIPA
jgi:hypothetical protein